MLAFVTGLLYLRSAALIGWRWTTGWAAAAVAGIMVEFQLIRVVVLDVQAAGRPPVDQPTWKPGLIHVDWGALALSAGFVRAGLAMVAVLVIRCEVR